VFNFPEAWEECLAPFDDLGIHAGQKPSGPLFMAFSMAITGTPHTKTTTTTSSSSSTMWLLVLGQPPRCNQG